MRRLACLYGAGMLLLGVALGAAGDTKGTLQSIRAKKPAPTRPKPREAPPRKAASKAVAKVKRTVAAQKRTGTPVAARSAPTASKPVAVTPPEDSLTQGRVAWWPMEGDARDIAGGNDGQFRRGISAVPGVRGVALQFDGNKSGINIPDTPPLQFEDSFSISAWVTIFALPPEGYAQQIFFRGDSRAGLDPYCLCVTHLGHVVFLVDSGAGDTRIQARVPLRTRMHISATLDTKTQQMRIYVDGKVAAETKTAHRPFRKLDPKERPGIAIGNTQSSGEHEQAFYGILDELQVHSRALTPEEVARLAQP